MRRAALCAAGLLGASLFLAGCPGEGGADEGKTITSTTEAPKVDVEAEIKKIQDNPNIPENAKAASIANLRRGQEIADKQNEVKSGGK